MRREVAHVAVLTFAIAPLVFAVGAVLFGTGLLGVGGPQPEPPEAALRYGGREVEPEWTTIGCWREKRPYLPDNEACVASEHGVRPPDEPPPRGTPRVEPGEALRFTTDWPHEPEAVSARAVRVDEPPDDALAMEQDRERNYGDRGVHHMPLGFEVLEMPVRRDGSQTEIVADLTPGEYLVSVRVRVDDDDAVGEAYYDFEIVVEE